MKYPYMTLPDETEITHGDMRDDGTVLVYIETPVDGGFNSAYCVLPSYECSWIQGYTKDEISRFDNASKIPDAKLRMLCRYVEANVDEVIEEWE